MPPKTAPSAPAQPAAPARRKRRPLQEVTGLILDAAREEFRRNGYDNATTAAIARRAGTTEAQLFRTFGSKADLFRESVFDQVDRHFAAFNARHLVGDLTSEAFRPLSRLYIKELHAFLAEHSQLLLSLFVAQTYTRPAMPGVHEIDALRTYFAHGAEAVERNHPTERQRIDPKLLVRISFGAVLAAVLFKSWLSPAGLADDEAIEEAVVDFVIDGISAITPGQH